MSTNRLRGYFKTPGNCAQPRRRGFGRLRSRDPASARLDDTPLLYRLRLASLTRNSSLGLGLTEPVLKQPLIQKRCWPRLAVSWAFVLFWLACSVRPAWAQLENERCLWCHGKPSIATRSPEELLAMVRVPKGEPLPRRSEDTPRLYTPEEVLSASAHGKLDCVDCHHGVESLPHIQRLSLVRCGDCHFEIETAVASGPHDPGASVDGRKRPACTDCHGPAHSAARVEERRHYTWAVQSTRACIKCHDNGRANADNYARSYEENVHGHALFQKGLAVTATCADCHGPHAVLPPSDPDSPLHPLRTPETCGRCHEGVAEVYFTSIHGQQLRAGHDDAAACTTCHSSHGISKVGDPFLAAVVNECSHCHLELAKTYRTSYHGKATSLGGHDAAVCSSCHGAHDILPKSDSRSRVAVDNLQATCGRCHQGVNRNFVGYRAHVDHRDRESSPMVYYTWLTMMTLLLSVLALFVPHALLWFVRESVDKFRRSGGHHRQVKEGRRIQRFHPVHRWTHLLIILSFMGLVATGFPLKYSHTAWAKELSTALGGVHVMGNLHRLFAVLTFVYAGLHAIFLVYFFIKKCPRPRLKYLLGPNSMVFTLRDLKDVGAMLRWFFFLGPRPKFERWTYFEKFDYWGEIWGIVVIGGTGLILWFPTVFTTWLPGWVLNCAMVIHSIEALLAASVIFLVHFFNTHLRPDKFPVDMVMLTGQMSEGEMKEERGAEYERLVASGELEERVVPPTSLSWLIFGRIAGVTAFLFGIALIVLALIAELQQHFGFLE